MSGMFKNCNKLSYINLLKLEIAQNILISDIFFNINENISYCINNEEKANIIINEFDKIENSNNICTVLFYTKWKINHIFLNLYYVI